MVFAYSYCKSPLLGVVLVDAYKYKLLLLNICLSYNVYILGGFSKCFFKVLLVSFSLFRLSAARVPFLFFIVIKDFREVIY